jgi:hypothetical protein
MERRLEHESGEARAICAVLQGRRVGIEAARHTRWFERMLAEMGHELWIGDAAQIRTGGPLKPGFGLTGALRQLDRVFPSVDRITLASPDSGEYSVASPQTAGNFEC